MLSLIKVFVKRSINKGKTQQEELEHRLPESVCQLEAQNLDRLPAYPMLSVTGVIKVWSLRAQDFLRAGSNLGMERSALTQQCRTKNMQDPVFTNNKRILYVDGYEDNRLLLTYVLEGQGYSCIAASTMRAGLAIASSRVFDLYILDNWYTDGNGIELCKRIRKFDRSAPIVFFSAWALASAQQEAINAGASAYVLKPALDEVLILTRILLTDQKRLSEKPTVATDLPRSVEARGCNPTLSA